MKQVAKFNVQARHKARILTVQALFQWQFNNASANALEKQYCEDIHSKNADIKYFKELLHGVLEHREEIDAAISPILDRDINKLTPIELTVLRLAVYELKFNLQIPYRVVINEALELTKSFGTVEGYKYVNGVLDHLAKSIRSAEIKS